jgi:hypothetical protein
VPQRHSGGASLWQWLWDRFSDAPPLWRWGTVALVVALVVGWFRG